MRDNTDIVAQVKADLEARGVNLSGPCGAFEITRRVAWALRGDGVGLLQKTSGNNCNGCSVDVVCYRDGTWVDVLINSETENRPAWQVGPDKLDPSRWLPPIDPGGTPAPVPEPTPAARPADDELDKLLIATGQLIDGIESLTGAIEALDTRIVALRNSGLRVHL